MKEITEIINGFKRIGLADLNSVKLMNRTDTKFVLSLKDLPDLLKPLSANYKVLSIDDKFNLPYKTLYYDTPDFAMYLKHHNGALNRFKIRHRTYLENKTGFLEVKFRNNKGRTIKERIARNEFQSNFIEKDNDFISSKTPYEGNELIPSVLVNYSRFTFVNENGNEKVTIDSDLSFSNASNKYDLKELVIVEVKRSNMEKSPAITVLKELKVRPMSISKYCIGVNYLYPNVKKNNFKEKLITLNKIIHGTSVDHIAGI